jgi:hypothetical protein
MRLAGGVPWRHVLVEHALVALGPNGPLVRARTSTRPSNTCNEPRDWDPAGPRRAVTPPHRIAPALPPLDWPPPGQARPLEQGDEAVHVINFDCQSHCREVKSCRELSVGGGGGRMSVRGCWMQGVGCGCWWVWGSLRPAATRREATDRQRARTYRSTTGIPHRGLPPVPTRPLSGPS